MFVKNTKYLYVFPEERKIKRNDWIINLIGLTLVAGIFVLVLFQIPLR